MYNLNCTPTILGYKVEEKLCMGVREQKRLNTTALIYTDFQEPLPACICHVIFNSNTYIQVAQFLHNSLGYLMGDIKWWEDGMWSVRKETVVTCFKVLSCGLPAGAGEKFFKDDTNNTSVQ
jgi:hypothetical protein